MFYLPPRPALHYEEVEDAIAKVKASDCLHATALCFEWKVLTAVRPGEARKAVWGEINREDRVWEIPAERMKSPRPHRVPLSVRCMEILEDAEQLSILEPDDLLFPNSKGLPISDVTMVKLLKELDIPAVAHGFRASFRTWTQEMTTTPREIAEACLAHVVQNKTEAAYARSDFLEKRRVVMQLWADYLEGEFADVEIAIKSRVAEGE